VDPPWILSPFPQVIICLLVDVGVPAPYFPFSPLAALSFISLVFAILPAFLESFKVLSLRRVDRVERRKLSTSLFGRFTT